MKIGVDSTALVSSPTGVGNYVTRLLVPIIIANPEIDFILFSNEEVYFPIFDNVRICTSMPKRRGPYWQNTHLREMLFKEQPQAFWATNGLLPFWGLSGIGTVLTVHDLVYKFVPNTLPFISLWGRRIGQRLAVAKADKVIFVSHATATDAEAAYGRKADAIIPPLVDQSFKRPLEATLTDLRLRLKLPERYLLALGTLEPRKNLVSLIDAYLKRRESGVALPLLAIAGGKGWLDNDIAARLEHGEELGFVRRLGYVDLGDLPALYAGCEVFLMPSLYEGFGMPLLEAQLCGAAVIHGPHASMREAAGDLGCITPTDVAGIEAMLDALSLGCLPVACRLPRDIVNDAEASADRLWELLMTAAREKSGIIA